MKQAHLAGAILCLAMLSAAPLHAQYKDVIEEWANVQAPKPPELKPVTLDSSTAVLSLDFVKQTCNNERRPRCLSTIPRVEGLLKQARAKKLTVIHSITSASTPADILKEVAPQDGEPIVKAAADKFHGTDLEKILKEKGIKTVIVTGTAAQGAVLNTGSQAAFRGIKVVIPVDGMSAENLYFEQYTAYHMTNSPGVGQQTTLTRIDMIK
ncbi:MAG TPA: isochorismatase family protein [Candidatus Binatia bacterium]|jgi:nicotinamidase-related amidase